MGLAALLWPLLAAKVASTTAEPAGVGSPMLLSLLVAFSLVTRRFNDAGLPGIALGVVSLALLAVLFGTGQYAWGTAAMAVLYVAGCVLPGRRAEAA